MFLKKLIKKQEISPFERKVKIRLIIVNSVQIIYEMGGVIMSLITWNDNFSVNIPQFDQEHQQLIAMINSLHEAMKQGTGKKAMGTLLDDLTNYASTHFSHEEQMMVRYSYPDFKKHKQSHVDFAQTIKEYRSLYENSSLSAGNLLNLFQSWLINHICDTDKQYTAFFKAIH